MVESNHNSGKAAKGRSFRSVSLDAFRAIMILLFIFFNFLGTFVPQSGIPFFLKHNQGNVLLFGDLVAPAFAFILGAALYFSYRNSRAKGFAFEFRSAIRFIELILLGIILDGLFCNGLLSFCPNWGVLQSLGLGGLFALLFIDLDNNSRLAVGILLLVVYSQININLLPFPSADPFRHGGVIGGIGYGFVALFGVISAEWFLEQKRNTALLGAALFILALAAAVFIPFNKLEVTAPFILISSSLAAFAWLLLSNFESKFPEFWGVLGRHSLLLWVLQYILVWYPIAIFNIDVLKFDVVTGVIISIVLELLLVSIVLVPKMRFKRAASRKSQY